MSKFTPDELAQIEARMRALPEPDLTDPENPEWTEEDFARAVGPEHLSDVELAAFPRTRGRPKKEDAKVAVSLRLSPDVLSFYRGRGAGWQGYVEQILRGAMTTGAASRKSGR